MLEDFKFKKILLIIAVSLMFLWSILFKHSGDFIDGFITFLFLSLGTYYIISSIFTKGHKSQAMPTISMLLSVLHLTFGIVVLRAILMGNYGIIIERIGLLLSNKSVVVGTILLFVLFIFYFIVANGYSRAAEVLSRFSYDGTSGKQMQIDLELQKGNIYPSQAIKKREKLDKENTFYSSMVVVSKFVKGSVNFGIILTLVSAIFGSLLKTTENISFMESLNDNIFLVIGAASFYVFIGIAITIGNGILLSRTSNEES